MLPLERATLLTSISAQLSVSRRGQYVSGGRAGERRGTVKVSFKVPLGTPCERLFVGPGTGASARGELANASTDRERVTLGKLLRRGRPPHAGPLTALTAPRARAKDREPRLGIVSFPGSWPHTSGARVRKKARPELIGVGSLACRLVCKSQNANTQGTHPIPEVRRKSTISSFCSGIEDVC